MPSERLLGTVVIDVTGANSIIHPYKCLFHLHREHMHLFVLSKDSSKKANNGKKQNRIVM
jgi:hypothetical protein